ncbi:MAG: ATP-binding protein [Thermoclostridium sp.]|nr:ATP-binding protein [Thermoclostridium sp.]
MNDYLLLELAGICLYRNLLKDKSVQGLVALIRLVQDDNAHMESIISAWSEISAELFRMNAVSFHQHVKNIVSHDENAFTLACERHEATLESPLTRQAASDLKVLGKLASIKCSELKKKMKEKMRGNLEVYRIIDELPDWNPQPIPATDESGPEAGIALHQLKHFNDEAEAKTRISSQLQQPIPTGDEGMAERIFWHQKNGAGLLSAHSFFIWDGTSLKPVINPDPVTLDKLYLLDSQKELAVKNTKLFLSGKAANNILFYGDRGTGKSSLVKALANEFFNEGLRLVEIPKKYLDQIPMITAQLSGRGLNFILFIDDLSFENNEEKFTALKAVLEGGLEYKPGNILLYATSNRRHLVKENFADRKGIYSDNPEEEIRARDGIQEKLSLSDRFGITIVFSSPLKKEYLQIIHKMAEEENLEADPAILEQKAMQWEMAYNGMSPRTARQFINWMKAAGDPHSGS